jgi:lipoate-protein ligase A
MPTLRSIIDPPRSASFNMAADIWALEHIPENCVWVRFYHWETPTITIGYMQKPEAVLDCNACNKNHVSWIRRSTGGRAVLHEGDITYSCIFPLALSPMGKTIQESYTIVSECLLKGLALAGIDACSLKTDVSLPRAHLAALPCFLSPGRREITVHGKKLIGSAQKRTQRAVLQHGSVPVTDAYRRLPDYLPLSPEQRALQKQLLREKSICVHEINPACDSAALTRSLARGFSEGLGFKARQTPWTEKELQEITTLSTSPAFTGQWMKSAC